MKIFYIQTNSEAFSFGVGTYLKNLTSGMTDKNVEVCLIKINRTPCAPSYKKIKKANFVEIEINIQDNSINQRQLLNEDHTRTLFGLIAEELSYEGKIVFHLNTIFDYWIVEIAKEYEFYVVYTQHVNLWQIFYEGDYKKFMTDWHRREDPSLDENVKTNLRSIEYDQKILEKSDQVILLNTETTQFTSSFYKLSPNKISLINNGLSEFKKHKKELVKQDLGFHEDDFVLTFVGRMTEQKGLNVLIEAFHKFSKENQRAKLVVVGKGDFERYLELAFKSSGRIVFTGFLQKEELNKIYSISDLCICTSKSEQNSYVILEMMSKGLPIIISDIEAHNNEKYIDSVNVLKVPLKNKEIKSITLLDVINKAYNNPELLKMLGINSYKTYISHFTQNQMTNSTLQVYSRLIEQ